MQMVSGALGSLGVGGGGCGLVWLVWVGVGLSLAWFRRLPLNPKTPKPLNP